MRAESAENAPNEAQARAASAAPWAWWETAALLAAVATALLLATANLAAPSLWHDELVHVYVARAIAGEGAARLPSGVPYHSGTLFNHLLAAVTTVFGDSERAVRAPSALLHALNVVLVYGLARCWAGRGVAVGAAILLAASPWSVAWARQARFYTLQQTMYLLFLAALWGCVRPGASSRSRLFGGVGLGFAYLGGLLASFHSVFFLPALALCGALAALFGRWRVAAGLCAAVLPLLPLTYLLLRMLMNPTDVQATTTHAGIGLHLDSLFTRDRWFYVHWLNQNMSTGFLILAFAGAAALPWRRGFAGWFPVLAFAGPMLALTMLLNYRWDRFLFFAYPALVVLQAGGFAAVCAGIRRFRGSPFRLGLAMILLAFSARLALSAARLLGDSLDTAGGAPTTLAAHHPDWRPACHWVRDHAGDAAVIASSYLPVDYYLGRVDDWFPNTWYGWESQDSGMPGIPDTAGLADFMATHPRGYYIAEDERIWKRRDHVAIRDVIEPMADWVDSHLERVPEAEGADVRVYRWPKSGAVP